MLNTLWIFIQSFKVWGNIRFDFVSNRDARYWIFADIRYADISKPLLADTDTDTDNQKLFFFSL